MFKVNKNIVNLKKNKTKNIVIVNFEHISHFVLVLLLLTLSRYMPAGKAVKKETLVQVFPSEFKNTFFTEHRRTTASAFSFSKAATGGVLGKQVFLKISENSQENTFGFAKFSKVTFHRTTLDDCFWLFRVTLLKWDTVNSVWKTSDEYSLSRNTNLRSTVQVYHFFFQQDKLSVYVFIGLQCLLPEAAIRVEVFCKKKCS